MNIRKYDMVFGTVVKANRNGVTVHIEEKDVLGFCKSCMNVGDTAWFTVRNFRIDLFGMFLTLEYDSIVEYGDIAA